MRAWVKDKMGVDVTKVPHYDPHGISKHGDGSGFRHWNRWDISEADIRREMGDYALQHTTGGLMESPEGAVQRMMNGVLGSGGEFTSTTGRIRKGVSLGTGVLYCVDCEVDAHADSGDGFAYHASGDSEIYVIGGSASGSTAPVEAV